MSQVLCEHVQAMPTLAFPDLIVLRTLSDTADLVQFTSRKVVRSLTSIQHSPNFPFPLAFSSLYAVFQIQSKNFVQVQHLALNILDPLLGFPTLIVSLAQDVEILEVVSTRDFVCLSSREYVDQVRVTPITASHPHTPRDREAKD